MMLCPGVYRMEHKRASSTTMAGKYFRASKALLR